MRRGLRGAQLGEAVVGASSVPRTPSRPSRKPGPRSAGWRQVRPRRQREWAARERQMQPVRYRIVGEGLAPRRTRLEVPGWAGEADPRADGSPEHPWHCTPFSEAARYGIEILFPFAYE